MSLSSRPSFLCPNSAYDSDEVQEICAVSASNSLARFATWQSRIVAKDHTDIIVEAPRVLRPSTTKLSLRLLLPSRPVSIGADTMPETEAKERKVEESSPKQARSYSTAQNNDFG